MTKKRGNQKKRYWISLLLPIIILLSLLLSVFGNDEPDKEVSTIISTINEESSAKSVQNKRSLSYENILDGYDLACVRSDAHNQVYYKLFDFDSDLETEFTLIYKRHSTELNKIEVDGSYTIAKTTENAWEEIWHISDEYIVELKYEIVNVDGIDEIIKYDYKGDESERFGITDLEEAVGYLRAGLKKHDTWNIERLLTP